MQNFNPLIIHEFLNRLNYYQSQPQNQQIAYAPMTPEQQNWANSIPRRDNTLLDTNLNYIPTIEQINKMNGINARGLTTEDREQIRTAREAYDAALRRAQGN